MLIIAQTNSIDNMDKLEIEAEGVLVEVCFNENCATNNLFC